jgi:hypothetical protein
LIIAHVWRSYDRFSSLQRDGSKAGGRFGSRPGRARPTGSGRARATIGRRPPRGAAAPGRGELGPQGVVELEPGWGHPPRGATTRSRGSSGVGISGARHPGKLLSRERQHPAMLLGFFCFLFLTSCVVHTGVRNTFLVGPRGTSDDAASLLLIQSESKPVRVEEISCCQASQSIL